LPAALWRVTALFSTQRWMKKTFEEQTKCARLDKCLHRVREQIVKIPYYQYFNNPELQSMFVVKVQKVNKSESAKMRAAESND
jgi:hypothetical protein